MSKVFITGIAGELGSHFARLCIDKGYEVTGVDIVRFDEAWRLKWLGISDKITYIWKSTLDLNVMDVDGSWLVLDAACQPDRPLGTTSPTHTLLTNLLGPQRLLECITRCNPRPAVIYPSSCNIFLGVPPEQQPLTERTAPAPINFYGWTKLSAEELYRMYHRCYGITSIIIRTGSSFGEGMRSDQMIARCILHMLNNRDFVVRSPEASRTYTYTKDVLEFYDRLIEKLWDNTDEFSGIVIHNGGNMENRAYRTIEVAEMIKKLTDSRAHLLRGEYEVGELLPDGRPVQQWESSELAYKLVGWKPRYTLKEGLKKTIKWFEDNIDMYV